MSVLLLKPSLCQPNGDAAVFCGLISVWKPWVGFWLVMGTTRYCIECR